MEIKNFNSEPEVPKYNTPVDNVLPFLQDSISINIRLSQAIFDRISDSEKATNFLAFAEKLVKYLPDSECDDFLKDPINFTSEKLAFRGFGMEMYANLKNHGFYTPQNGQHCGVAVYMSNCPYSAFTYNKGVVAVIDREKLVYKTEFGLVDVASDTYTTENDRYLESMDSTRRRSEVYTMDNRWDLIERTSSSNPDDRILSLRKPQPIAATVVFMVFNGSEVLEEYPVSIR